MIPVKIKAKVFTDNSGMFTEVPAIVCEEGVVKPLLDYIVQRSRSISISTQKKIVHAVYLLLKYMEANKEVFPDPEKLFQSFSQRLFTGTISEDGSDSSGLYWPPMSKSVANSYIAKLNTFSDYLAQKYDTKSLNPLRKAYSYEEKMENIAYLRRTHNQFLGHIKNPYIGEVGRNVRQVMKAKELTALKQNAQGFPESEFGKFYILGLGGAKDRRVSLRNQLIVLLMHYGGLRVHECLNIWLDDVTYKSESDGVRVNVYHPSEGTAPYNWKSVSGVRTREAYLREVHGLRPRNMVMGTQLLGFKNRTVENEDGYIPVHFFPREVEVIFGELWKKYCSMLLKLNLNHPYAFVSFSNNSLGNSLTLTAFYKAYQSALKRIGKTMRKSEGFAPHSHRHAVGRRLVSGKANPRVIQKVLHHSAIESQEPYTIPGIKAVTHALNEASERMTGADDPASRIADDSWREILEYGGFGDIDPKGLLSGKSPKLVTYSKGVDNEK